MATHDDRRFRGDFHLAPPKHFRDRLAEAEREYRRALYAISTRGAEPQTEGRVTNGN